MAHGGRPCKESELCEFGSLGKVHPGRMTNDARWTDDIPVRNKHGVHESNTFFRLDIATAATSILKCHCSFVLQVFDSILCPAETVEAFSVFCFYFRISEDHTIQCDYAGSCAYNCS